MTIYDPEVYSKFGALDSDAVGSAIRDNRPSSGHVLRAAGMDINRLIQQGGPMLVLPFDAAEDGNEEEKPGGHVSYGLAAHWDRVYFGPIRVPKKKNLRFATVRVEAKVEGTRRILLQVATSRAPLNRAAQPTDDNVLIMTGDGTTNFLMFELLNLPLDSEDYEEIELWAACESTETLALEATIGPHNTGVADTYGTGAMEDTSAAWLPAVHNGAYYIVFKNAAGAMLAAPRMITAEFTGGDFISWQPDLTPTEARLLGNSSSAAQAQYYIYKLIEYRIGSVSIYADDRAP